MTAHAGVVVEDNTFVVGDVTLLQAKSVAGLDVRGNTVVRDDTTRSLALTVDRTTLAVGESAVASATGTATTASAPLFRLQGSRDVRLHDNRYDAGFNRRVDVSGMRAGDVTVEDAGFRVGADARTDGLGTVGFTSSRRARRARRSPPR